MLDMEPLNRPSVSQMIQNIEANYNHYLQDIKAL